MNCWPLFIALSLNIWLCTINSLCSEAEKPVTIISSDEKSIETSYEIMALSETWANQYEEFGSEISSSLSEAETKTVIRFLDLITQNNQQELIQNLRSYSLRDLCLLLKQADSLAIEQLMFMITEIIIAKLLSHIGLLNFIHNPNYITSLGLPHNHEKLIAQRLLAKSVWIDRIISAPKKLYTDSMVAVNCDATTFAYTDETDTDLHMYRRTSRKFETLPLMLTCQKVLFHPSNSNLLACIFIDNTISIIDINSHQKIGTLQAKSSIFSFSWHPTDPDVCMYELAYELAEQKIVWNIKANQCLGYFPNSGSWNPINPHLYAIFDEAAFLSAINSVISGGTTWFNQIIIKDITKPNAPETCRFMLENDLPQSIVWHPKLGHILYVITNDYVYICDTREKKIILSLKNKAGTLEWNPNNPYLCAHASGDTITLWDIKTSKSINQLSVDETILSISWNLYMPHLIALLTEKSVIIWNIFTQTHVTIISHPCDSLDWCPFQPHIVAITSKTIDSGLWNIETGNCLYTFAETRNKYNAVSFKKNLLILDNSANTRQIWNLEPFQKTISLTSTATLMQALALHAVYTHKLPANINIPHWKDVFKCEDLSELLKQPSKTAETSPTKTLENNDSLLKIPIGIGSAISLFALNYSLIKKWFSAFEKIAGKNV